MTMTKEERVLRVINGEDVDYLPSQITFSDRTRDKEISEYVVSGEPLDKAGAYGIQGRGGKLVDRFEGSYSNVIGFPLELLSELLQEFGVSISAKFSNSL